MDHIQVMYTLAFEAPFHFGTGIRKGLIDRSIIRDSEGYLYVPGSTLKGTVREQCEQLARFYSPSAEEQQRIASPHNALAALSDFGATRTMITRIFGSPRYPGLLRFDDAQQEDPSLFDGKTRDDRDRIGKFKDAQTGISTQVRLDRLTHTAVDEALYTSEFGIRGLVFVGSISGWLECIPVHFAETEHKKLTVPVTPSYSLLLLLAGLLMIERLGGSKSTGKGHCQCTITELQVNKLACPAEQWQAWIEHLEILTKYPSAQVEEAGK
jgi:CRISPR/Cas system CMR subunit Cmr4 (Cas7 group RAMP superfamily)